MRTVLFTLCLLASAALPAPARAADPKPQSAQPAAAKPFELLDGDRVVFVGGTFFDREARLGYIETALTSRFPDRNITFRNLGYAGDTVRCEGRTVCEGWANFGPPDEGFEKLKKLVAEIKPTVVFVAYGMGESFEGEQNLPQFVKDYNKLLDMLTEVSGGKPRFVLVGPNYHEDLGRPLPEPAGHNAQLKAYTEAVASIASERGARYVDLFGFTAAHQAAPHEMPLTHDGIQLTPRGYWVVAREINRSLDSPGWHWDVRLQSGGKLDGATGVKVEDVKGAGSGLAFTATSATLPQPPIPSPSNVPVTGVQSLRLAGLAAGDYALKAGGAKLAEAPAAQWAKVVTFSHAPDEQQAEKLRELIVAKNADYFNYWRHENDTYILGYRKHEQGKNAVEFPEFVRLAEAKDKEINKLKVPQPVTYTLEKEAGAGK